MKILGLILVICALPLIGYDLVYAQEATPQIDVLSSFGLKEGEVVGSQDLNDPDIFIVNIYGYKRLFLNPQVFNLYGHLKGGYAGVKKIPSDVLYLLPASGLFRNCETQEEKVYALEVIGEDDGALHWVNINGSDAIAGDPDFFKKVFCINTAEFKLYAQGSPYTAISQIPSYVRLAPSFEPTAVSQDDLDSKKITYDPNSWKIHSNSKHNFSMRYPDLWGEKRLEDEGAFLGGQIASLEAGIVPDVGISVNENPGQLSAKDFLGQLAAGVPGYTFDLGSSSGYVAKSNYGFSLAIPVGDHMLVISGITISGMANFDAIIKTLQII